MLPQFSRLLLSSNNRLAMRAAEAIAASRILFNRVASLAPMSQHRSRAAGDLMGEADAVCISPRPAGGPSRQPLRRVFPPIRWRMFSSAIVHPHSSFVVSRGVTWVEDAILDLIQRDDAFYGSDFCRHSRRVTCLDHHGSEHVPRGIALFGNGSGSWYHWVMEALSRGLLASDLPGEFADWPLLVPPEVAGYPSFMESLRLVAGHRRWIVCKQTPLRVDHLIWVDSPSVLPFNLLRGFGSTEQCFHHRLAISRLREALLAPCRTMPESPFGRKLFVVRPTYARAYNQADCERLLGEFGFRSIAPERLPLREQLRAFHDARLIVGPNGGAWTNLLFTGPGTRALAFVPAPMAEVSVFSNLAHQVGAHLAFVPYPTEARVTSDLFRASFHVDPEAVRAAITKEFAEAV